MLAKLREVRREPELNNIIRADDAYDAAWLPDQTFELLVETLRFRTEGADAIRRPGLLVGLADPLLGRALRRLHSDVAHAWSVEELAREAGLSRSVFGERFGQYLMEWRVALAKAMLQRAALPLETVASAIGYQSASAFTTAFRREVGTRPVTSLVLRPVEH